MFNIPPVCSIVACSEALGLLVLIDWDEGFGGEEETIAGSSQQGPQERPHPVHIVVLPPSWV